jgi:plasmid stability protein
MMPNLSIKDVPEAWAEALRQQAARNHRSLQGELMAMVQRTVNPEAGIVDGRRANAENDSPGRARVVGYDGNGFPIVRQGWKTVDQVVAELSAMQPPPPNQASSIAMIREDRDSR